jgi:diguanylate cyclase (GGDEF)-like protein
MTGRKSKLAAHDSERLRATWQSRALAWGRQFAHEHIRGAELSLIGIAAVLVGLWAVYIDAFELLADFVHDHDDWQLDELIILALFGGVAAFVLLLRRARDLHAEVGRRQAAEVRATSLARHDSLTGLPNRRVLIEDLDAALATVSVSGGECAVYLIDLDLFKPVNDIYGHAVGDAVLVEVATRIINVVAEKGTAARMGGDEFACVVSYAAGSDLPTRMAGQIVRSLNQPIFIEGKRVQVGATIGITRAPHDGTTATDLLHGADLAMYDGKRKGRGSYRFFHTEMNLQLRERAALEADLRVAVATGNIVPHFQPVMNLRDNRILGFEALARWMHPSRGMIPPDTFIPIAEDLGIIDEVSYSMLRDSCTVAREWPPTIWLSVNISPIQLKDPWLSTRLLGILVETGFAPGRLIIEVTENSIIDDMVRAREVFQSLQNAGVRIALDDFGKGYSSLYHLRQLQIDQLKRDGSFIHAMDSPESAKIVSAIAGLGKALGMPVTAEGVETIAEADALRALGCEHGQGFLFGRALNAAETAALLAELAAGGALKTCSA